MQAARAEYEAFWRERVRVPSDHQDAPVMPEAHWSSNDLQEQLRRFEAELRAAGLAENSVKTYVSRADAFLRWLTGDFIPRGPITR